LAWRVRISQTAVKQLKKIDRQAQKRLLTFFEEKIEGSENPRMMGKALRGNKGKLWRYRVGDYRVICSINDHLVTVLVLEVGHRKEIYR